MAGGTGNLILKRGIAIPDGSPASLLKAMPAVQLIGLSPVSNDGSVFNTGDTKAFANYPNRLWVGMDALGGSSWAEGSSGTGGNSGGILPLGDPGTGGPISSQLATRPVWMGAEIRANVAVFHPDDTGTSAVPTVLEADWANPSDYVLVTQKAIYQWASGTFGSSGSVTATSSNTASTVYPLFVTTVGSSTTLLADDSTTALSYVPSTGTLTVAGDLAVNGGDITTSTGTATVFNTTATTVSIGGAANIVNIGGTGPTVNISTAKAGNPTLALNCGGSSTATISCDVTAGQGNIFTGITTGTLNLGTGITTGTLNLATGGASTLNLGTGGASTTNIGGTGASVNIGTTSGDSTLTIRGTSTTGTATIATNSGVTTANLFNTNATTVNIGGGATTGVNIGNASGTVTIAGNLTVNGTTTNINTTNLVVEDKNIVLGDVTTPIDATTADGGGITLKGASADKTLTWNNTNIGGTGLGVWRSSETFSILSGKVFAVGDDAVLSKTNWRAYNAGNGGGYVGFKAPNTGSSIGTQDYTLPSAYPDSNKVLQSDTSGNLSWVSTGTASNVGVTATETNTNYNLVLTTATSNSDASLVVDDGDNVTYNTSTNTLTVPVIDGPSSNLIIGKNSAGNSEVKIADFAVGNSNTKTVSIGSNGGNNTGTTSITIGSNTSNNHTTSVDIGSPSTHCSVTISGATVISGTTTIGGASNLNGATSVVGSFETTGSYAALNTNNFYVLDKNIQIGTPYSATATPTANVTSGQFTVQLGNTSNLLVGQVVSSSGTGSVASGAKIASIDSSTQITLDSAHTASGTITNLTFSGTPTNFTADLGGITLKGATDKTFNWVNSTSAWTSSEHMNLATGKAYYINGISVLSGSTLGTGVTGSSLTSVGTLTSGTWNASVIGMTYGGTGKNLTPALGGVVYTDADSMEVLAAGTSGYVLKSNGNGAAPAWVDPSTLASGAASSVTVRRETSTNNTTKYPIPFLGSTSPSGSNPASGWSSLTADELTQTSYLLTDVTSSGSSSTPTSPTNSSTGLFYEVSDGSSLIGTLYCDYIGATLDCGTY